MKVNNGTVHVAGGSRKQGKSGGFTKTDWSFKPEHSDRLHTVLKIQNQYVQDEKGTPHSCIITKKKDKYGYFVHIATCTVHEFDEKQGCTVTKITDNKFKVRKDEGIDNFWIFDDYKEDNKRRKESRIQEKKDQVKNKHW